MIRITNIKVDISKNTEEVLKKEILRILKISESGLHKMEIVKKSIDARKKKEIKYIFTVDVTVEKELSILNRVHNPNVTPTKTVTYDFKPSGDKILTHRPVIVGTGPAGMFCALLLAESGYRPIVLERGQDVDKRIQTVSEFWSGKQLNPNSNVQFGEGGAGTFSDGKLNTMVKDVGGRNRKVLEEYVKYGAPSEIIYQNKPHIGTDRLRAVVKSMRERILELGGEVFFDTALTDLQMEDGKVISVTVNYKKVIPCEVLVLAIGHSARDTFSMLYQKGFHMTPKAFAVGVRIEHSQELINRTQYRDAFNKLPAADYKLTYRASNGRGVYSFCMCPGGFVVNASSEEGRLVVNGMSNYKRDEKNANSAIVVSVTPVDFGETLPLAGMEFQRKWEELAYREGGGAVPVQLFDDFCRDEYSESIGSVIPNIKGGYRLSNLRKCLPDYVSNSLVEGIRAFEKTIPGFAAPDTVLSGVETRTSSPLRIERDEAYESNMKGVYPCGEGAGYAGGITSAAMDGIKIYEAIAGKYKLAD